MVEEIRLQPRGLVTEPSRILAGDGGLIDANNVRVKDGLITPRGLITAKISSDARVDGFTNGRYAKDFDDRTYFACEDGATTRVYRDNSLAAPIIETTRVSSDVRACDYDGSQVWTFEPVIRCVDYKTSSTAFQRIPGAPRGVAQNIYASNDATSAITQNAAVSYQVVFVRRVDTSNNGTKVRTLYGAPSDTYLLRIGATASTFATVTIEVPIQSIGLQLGDEIQIYRSSIVTPSTGTPAPELKLRFSAQVSAADVAAGFATFTDKLSDAQWNGPVLYTSPSQEGILRENQRVRTAVDAALYAGKMFYAGATSGYRQSTVIKSIGASAEPMETLHSILTANCTWTSGSNVITAVPAAVFPYLRIGQRITGTTAALNADPQSGANANGLFGFITSFNAGAATITIDTNATANVTRPIIVWDWIGVSFSGTPTSVSNRIYASWVDIAAANVYVPDGNGTYVFNVTDGAVPWSLVGGSDIERCYARNYSTGSLVVNDRIFRLHTITSTDTLHGITLVAEYDVTVNTNGNADINQASQFAIVSSKTAAFSDPIAVDFQNAAPSAKAYVNGGVASLWWSKLYQYEAIPPTNQLLTIGDPTKRIMRIFGCTDRLWVLKSDGLWCVYGDGDTPADLVVTQVDPTFRMTETADRRYARWATRHGDNIYVWSVGGIHRINANGVQRIDEPISNDIRSLEQVSPTDQLATSSTLNELVVFGGKASLYNVTPFLYVFDTTAETWTTWSAFENIGATANAFMGPGVSNDGRLLFAARDGGFARYAEETAYNYYETAPGHLPPFTGDTYSSDSDAGYGVTISLVSSRTITLSAGTLAVGDVFYDVFAGGPFRVVANTHPTYTIDKTGCTAGVPIAIYRSASRLITFAATTQGQPQAEKYVGRTWISMQILRGGNTYEWTWRARGKSSRGTKSVLYDDWQPTASLAYPQYLNVDREYVSASDVPSAQSRFTGLQTSFNLRGAMVWFEIDGFVTEINRIVSRIEGLR